MPNKKSLYRLDISKWSVERSIFLIAGIFVLGSVALGFLWNRNAFYFTAFVGAMLANFSLSGYCPLAIIINWWKRKREALPAWR